MRIYAHRFDTCVFECFGTSTRSTFTDGVVNESHFARWIARGDNADLAGELGYSACEILYYWEHDFIHHFIADEKGFGPSEAIYSNNLDVRVRDASSDIRYEEMLVHCVQGWVRDPGIAWPLATFESWDPIDFMDRLRAALRSTFGDLFDMPSVIRRWHPRLAEDTFSHLQKESYGVGQVPGIPFAGMTDQGQKWPTYHVKIDHWRTNNRYTYHLPNPEI